MGISNYIDDATINIHETTILEIKRRFDLEDFSEIIA